MNETCTDIFAPDQSAVPYQLRCREERHFAAILFGLMSADRDRLNALVAKIGKRSGTPIELGDDSRVFFEYAKPRDLWEHLNRADDRNGAKRAVIEKGLVSCGAAPEMIESLRQSAAEPLAFNRLFTKHASPRYVASPATWVLDGEATDDGLLKAAKALKTAFKIKPDLVIETHGQAVVCIEAKLESKESVDAGVKQVETQRRMFRSVLGADPVMVLLAPKPDACKVEGAVTVTWAESFGCFDRSGREALLDEALAGVTRRV